MNKKLIVNENLVWPHLDDSSSKKIIDLIEANLKPYQTAIKREKTLPKHLRKKKAKATATESQGVNTKEISPNPAPQNVMDSEKTQCGMLLKKRFRVGINAVTKTLENEPGIIKFVLVCQSCSPLKLLTRHLQIMCAHLNVPAGCCLNLSKSLAKYLNVKTVSSFALCDTSLLRKSEETSSLEKENGVVTKLVNDLSDKIRKLLKPLDNPLSANVGLSKELIENTKLLQLDESKQQSLPETQLEVEMKIESASECEHIEEEFGSDFISFNAVNKNTREVSFDSNSFILFNDDYDEKGVEDDETTTAVSETRAVFMDRNFKKRKLNDYANKKLTDNKNHNFKFNKLKLISKKENNKNRRNKKDK